MDQLRPSYTCIVVGAGISGLTMALKLQKRHPSWSIAIAERYKGFGGRTYTYHVPDTSIHWEMGAGRIHKSHTLIMELLKEYGLTWVPIGSALDFKAGPKDPIVPDPFESMIVPIYIEPLSKLKPSVLASHTIEELMIDLYGPAKTKELLAYFPYRAEVNTLRADLALKSFLGGEMSSHEGYGIIAEGFSELIKRMREDLERQGVVMLPRHRLVDLRPAGGKATDLTFEFTGPPDGHITLRAEKACVLALHRDAVAELNPFQSWYVLQHLKCQPLLRTYAVFPVRHGKSWFSGLNRIVTPGPLRYIIPMNPKQGTIMISYTDTDDTAHYMNLQAEGGDKALEAEILQDTRKLFPELSIPKPTFFRSHPWEVGATYWLPGTYSPSHESEEVCHPYPKQFPGVFVCGESWSLRQAWVEGALEHTQLCHQKLERLVE